MGLPAKKSGKKPATVDNQETGPSKDKVNGAIEAFKKKKGAISKKTQKKVAQKLKALKNGTK